MRLFVAAYPPPAACDDLSARLDGLHVAKAHADGINTRLARRETWHVTLAFLGEVADSRAPSAAEALERAAPGPPVTLRLAGGGRFGRGRFTVLWVGVEGDGLDGLARRVRHELRKSKVAYDDRPFRPHLTVARPSDKLDDALIEADRSVLAAYEGPSWPVAEIRLMRSHLGPQPVYDRIAGYPVG
ncbi:RNA 2',3'-cyclic phosphodiesterase [Actinoplanes sp. NPDC051343]|uniref:RNA 2',3'-cyclic phosphodiesterase n=1 Tax=Actinoplanes sp. NPDC051343 TaxID=3363906 RepID=UPI0037A7341B